MGKSNSITWEEALNRCMPTILKLATALAKIPNAIIDKDDLINCGLIGLYEAKKNYLHQKKTQFSTFAYFRIKGSMMDEIRRYQPHKRNIIEKHKKIEQAKRTLQHTKNVNPTSQKALSRVCGLSPEEIDRIAIIISIQQTSADIDNMAKEDHNPEHFIQTKQRRERLDQAISRLPRPEQKVIDFRYHKELRLREIGDKLELSEARIHQLEKSALYKLKHIIREDDWEIAA